MILMYHHVAPPEAVPKPQTPEAGWNFIHSPKGFERQLVELKQRGYNFVSLTDLVGAIKSNGCEVVKDVAVTFDDGWIDNYIYALPILTRLKIPATFFITTRHIHEGAADQRIMNVSQLQELLAAGMTIGGHTRTHCDLTKVTLEQAREEIAGCKKDLEQALATKVSLFAYPGGAFNQRIIRLTQEAGYAAACSVLGPARNDPSSLFWLYRDVLTESMNSPGDWYRLSPCARRLLEFRVRRRLQQRLQHA